MNSKYFIDVFIRQNYSRCRLKYKQNSYFDFDTKLFYNYLMEFIWLDLNKASIYSQ